MTEQEVPRSGKSTSDPDIVANFIHASEVDEEITKQVRMQFEGLPYVGPSFNRKEGDPEKLQPVLKYTAHVKVFDMSKPKDLEEYELIWTRSMSTVAECLIGVEERKFDEVKKNWVIFLRWSNAYYTHPTAVEQVIPRPEL